MHEKEPTHEKKWHISQQTGLISPEPWEEELTSPHGLIRTHEYRPQLLPRVTTEEEAARLADKAFLGIRNNIAEAARLGRHIERVHWSAQRALQETILQNPGLLRIGNDLYYGWFTIEKDGKVYTLHRRKTSTSPQFEPFDVRREQWKNVNPYLILSPDDERKWQARIRSGPLSLAEAKRLESFPQIDAYPDSQRLTALRFSEYVKSARANIDTYCDRRDQLWKSNQEAEATEHVRSNLPMLAILYYTGQKIYRSAFQEITEKMDETGTTMFSLGEKYAVAGYLDGPEIVYRTLPIPIDKQRLFQRYLAHADPPLTLEEFKNQYDKLGLPPTKFKRTSTPQ